MNRKRNRTSFTKRETRAILITVALVTIGIILPPYAARMIAEPSPPTVTIQYLASTPDIPDPTQPGPDSIKPVPAQNRMNTKQRKDPPPVEINTADSIMWKSLPGIGNVLSKRIVKFRDKLGGFYSIDQVSETYGLPPETFASIAGHLELKAPHTKLAFYKSNTEDFGSHPYISWEQARAMDKLARAGYDSSIVEKLGAIGDSLWLDRVLPYLEFKQAP